MIDLYERLLSACRDLRSDCDACARDDGSVGLRSERDKEVRWVKYRATVGSVERGRVGVSNAFKYGVSSSYSGSAMLQMRLTSEGQRITFFLQQILRIC